MSSISATPALRYKALAARQAGAKALLIVSGPNSVPAPARSIPIGYDTAAAGLRASSPPASAATVADAIFAPRRQDAEGGAGRPRRRAIRTWPASRWATMPVGVEAKLTRQTATTYNVAGYLPATRALTGVAKPWVMLGAHYDHLGHGGRGSSLARAGEETKVHPGADDNASGVAAVLSAAGAAQERPARPQRRRRLLVRRGSGPARVGGVHRHAARSARSARRLLQLRHGRPPARRHAAGAGRRLEPGVGRVGRVGERRAEAEAHDPGRSQPADRLVVLQPGGRADAGVLHRQPRGLPPADRHRGPRRRRRHRSDRPLRHHHRRARRRRGRAAGLRESRAADARPRRPRRHAALHRHDSRLRQRDERACSSAASAPAARPNRPACRRATSSSRSPASRSPTSTTTPTRST